MSFKWLLTLLVLVVFFFLPFWYTYAQDDAGDYIVTSTQSINARSCPHVSCSVVTHFAPGELLTASEAVEGDVVSGSNRWLHIQQSGIDAYVHSSLVARSSDDTANATTTSAVNVDGWVEHSAAGFTVKTPTGYYDGAKLLANKELVRSLAEVFGLDPDDFAANIRESLKDTDMYLFSINRNGWLKVSHKDFGGFKMTPRTFEKLLVGGMEDNGVAVLDNRIVDLPAGTAVRLYVKWTDDQSNLKQEGYEIFYAIVTGDCVYFLDFSTSASTAATDEPIIDAMARSFQVSAPARDSQGRLVHPGLHDRVAVA